MTENWKAVPGYEGLYEVSDLGRVRSLDRVVDSALPSSRGYPKRVRGRMLRPQKHSAGYLHVGLSRKIHIISTLVLLAFRGPRPEGEEACHNDGDKRNNALLNLRWATHVENCADRVDHGTDTAGERNGNCVLTAAEVAAIRADKGRRTQRDLGEEYGVNWRHIGRIHRGERRARG